MYCFRNVTLNVSDVSSWTAGFCAVAVIERSPRTAENVRGLASCSPKEVESSKVSVGFSLLGLSKAFLMVNMKSFCWKSTLGETSKDLVVDL